MTQLAFIDTETTSLDPGERTAWEIAVITDDENGNVQEYLWQQHPGEQRLASANPEALKVGGFHDRIAAKQGAAASIKDDSPLVHMPFETMVVALQETLADRVLVGVNTHFDRDHVAALLAEVGLQPSWDYHLENITSRIAGYLQAKGTPIPPGSKSTVAYEALGFKSERAHTALGDARGVREAWNRMKSGAPALAA